MTTSSNNRTPAPNPSNGSHWQQLTDALPPSVQLLDHWMDEQLDVLEQTHEAFVTKRSLRKNLRR